MDEREYDEFIEFCKWILKANGFETYARDVGEKPDLRGTCIMLAIETIQALLKGD